MKKFRLIDTFDSTIHTFDIRKSPPYLAISHAWSEKIFPKQLPLDSSFGGDAIKRTLFKRGLSSVRYCWIDLFSIEQDSEDDVNEQIPLMGEIFSNAEAVLIILTNELNLTQEKIDYGTSQLDEALAIWEMEAWTDDGAREYWELGEGRTKLVQAMDILSCFTKTAWGTRIWTLQEYLLARNVLWIGSDLEPISINDELFIAIPRLCDEFEVAGCTARNLSINNDYSLLFSHFSGMAASRAKAIERTRVMELLGNRKATVPVDEVYGIMAATGVEISVRPKESRETAWKRWLEAALMAGHLRWLMIPPSILSAVQVLNNNFSRALRFVQRHMEHRFYPFLGTEQIRFIWADFMQLSAQTVMDIMSFGVAYLIRVQCPTTEMSFLTVLVTNGLHLKGDIVAFECNARGMDRRHILLIGQITLHEMMLKGWITHDVQLYTTTWSNMPGSLKAVRWQLEWQQHQPFHAVRCCS
ncbi:HET domain protein [Penicillium longicatenatum]|uniref:HET domain protein n=1 Tax=Penicillium longicatenatum TaxID=1561947 RepID=UPI0025498AE9|nr:HET domain protein [Penicillium longicatenatum]KAJ5640100.1 HET domain protein [Penicillium longicatenatum]